jgi:hypothetical protein
MAIIAYRFRQYCQHQLSLGTETSTMPTRYSELVFVLISFQLKSCDVGISTCRRTIEDFVSAVLEALDPAVIILDFPVILWR